MSRPSVSRVWDKSHPLSARYQYTPELLSEDLSGWSFKPDSFLKPLPGLAVITLCIVGPEFRRFTLTVGSDGVAADRQRWTPVYLSSQYRDVADGYGKWQRVATNPGTIPSVIAFISIAVEKRLASDTCFC